MAENARDYKELDVWNMAVELTISVYGLLKNFPKEESYALSDQMRRSAISIRSNIVEGASRNTTKLIILDNVPSEPPKPGCPQLLSGPSSRQTEQPLKSSRNT